MKTLKAILNICIMMSVTIFVLNCENDFEKSNTHEVKVTVWRSLYETVYSVGIWVNDDEVISKTECGSNHPTLSDEEPDCFTLGWDALFYEYETTLNNGDKISVVANTVQHTDECGELKANIYVDGNKVIWDEDNENDCSFLTVGCSWTINE